MCCGCVAGKPAVPLPGEPRTVLPLAAGTSCTDCWPSCRLGAPASCSSSLLSAGGAGGSAPDWDARRENFHRGPPEVGDLLPSADSAAGKLSSWSPPSAEPAAVAVSRAAAGRAGEALPDGLPLNVKDDSLSLMLPTRLAAGRPAGDLGGDRGRAGGKPAAGELPACAAGPTSSPGSKTAAEPLRLNRLCSLLALPALLLAPPPLSDAAFNAAAAAPRTASTEPAKRSLTACLRSAAQAPSNFSRLPAAAPACLLGESSAASACPCSLLVPDSPASVMK
jgi:hypothetical protein